MQKQLEGTQKYINEQCRQSCPYRWATHAIIVSNTHALPAEYKCLAINRAIIYECFAGFVLTISALPQWLHRQFSSAQFQKRRNDNDGFLWCYCCRFVLNSKRLLSTSRNKQGHAAASSIFFMVLFLMLFGSSQNRMQKIKQILNKY